MAHFHPELCENADDAHALAWLDRDFAYCPGCDLLYARQPGVLVWVYDPWANQLAEALMRAQTGELLQELGLAKQNLSTLLPDDLP